MPQLAVCVRACVYTSYTVRAISNAGINDDIWQRARAKLVRLALYDPAPHPHPHPRPSSAALTTTSGSNQSVTSELRCNKSGIALPPPCLFFSFFFSIPAFLPVFPGCFREQALVEGNRRAPAGLPASSPPSGRSQATARRLWPSSSPRRAQMCIFSSSLLLCN